MLTAQNLTKSYSSIHVLKGVSLDIKEGEIVAIVGASGAGKSTLLHILGTLDQPDKGALQIAGVDVLKLRGNALAQFRNKEIGFVFQFHNLLPEFTALENVCMPAYLGKVGEKQAQERAKELLGYLGLQDRIHHLPSQLSGGEQQRVSIARALVNRPKIVFADEPSGNLDSNNAQELHKLFFRLREEMRQTFVIVTHNQALAQMSDRTLEMRDGVMLKEE
ncbi:MAG: ABC transporter ATP-binding protein [Bacteroidetes bacterium]|nr:MAG: ABC transporter ATP-binding protein [Bacteroidota bacterium]